MGNEKILEDIRKLCYPFSLLVISDHRLIRIRCPFKVRVITNISGWREGDVVSVDKVMVTRDLLMIYLIEGNGYPYFFFQVLIM